jgi:hypothetical protein
MDKFNQLANQFLREYGPPISSSDNEIMVQMEPGKSFGDFLRSLTGKTKKDILDSGSFARLYSMNMHGIGGNKNSPDAPAVLLSKFLSNLGDFVNRDVMKHRPRIAETEEFKRKYGYNEYLEQEKERRQLFIDLIKAKEGPEKDTLRRKKNAFRNTSEYAEAMRLQNKKEDAAVEKFHNTPIEQGELVNDGSQEFKDLEKMYNQIQSMRKGVKIEDNENLDPNVKSGLNTIKAVSQLGILPKERFFSVQSGEKALGKALDKAYVTLAKSVNNAVKGIN